MLSESKFAPIKERPMGPIKTYDETEVLKSSNTWEFLIFEQLRALRFIQQTLFSEPRNVRFHILNLLTSMNHLESMLYDRINPNYESNTDIWVEYQKHKPSLFKNMHKNMDRIGGLINSNELTQFQLFASVEIWFRALDKYLNSIKRISPTVYEMKVHQYDNQVEMYNEKFGRPSLLIMNQLKSSGMLTTIDFDEKIEWTYYYLWHHEGRRARMGASMIGPDYTQWHGNFEVADRFYTEFIPEVRELTEDWKKHGKYKEAAEVEKTLNEILNSEMHQWFLGKMSPEEFAGRKKAAEEFRKRYSVQ